MASPYWSIVSTPLPPEVHATIWTEAWHLNTTTTINSTLSVLVNSLLILKCVASFPVVWKGIDREVSVPKIFVSQSVIQRLLQLPSEDNTDFKYLTPVYKGASTVTYLIRNTKHDYTLMDSQYTATVKFLNFSTKFLGSYACGNETVPDHRTVIKLEMHEMPESKTDFSFRVSLLWPRPQSPLCPQISFSGYIQAVARFRDLSHSRQSPRWARAIARIASSIGGQSNFQFIQPQLQALHWVDFPDLTQLTGSGPLTQPNPTQTVLIGRAICYKYDTKSAHIQQKIQSSSNSNQKFDSNYSQAFLRPRKILV